MDLSWTQDNQPFLLQTPPHLQKSKKQNWMQNNKSNTSTCDAILAPKRVPFEHSPIFQHKMSLMKDLFLSNYVSFIVNSSQNLNILI